jgi:hypothetical protein
MHHHQDFLRRPEARSNADIARPSFLHPFGGVGSRLLHTLHSGRRGTSRAAASRSPGEPHLASENPPERADGQAREASSAASGAPLLDRPDEINPSVGAKTTAHQALQKLPVAGSFEGSTVIYIQSLENLYV